MNRTRNVRRRCREQYETYIRELHTAGLSIFEDAPPWQEVIGRGPFGEVHEAAVPHDHVLDRAGLLDNARSVSWVATLPDDERKAVLRRLDELLDGRPIRDPQPREHHVGGAHVSVRLAVTVVAALVLSPSAAALQGRVIEDSFASKGLQSRLSFAVYLPPAYDAGTTRYPVVYYLHGLPANAQAFTSFRYVANALELAHRQAIVVAPQGHTTVTPTRSTSTGRPGGNGRRRSQSSFRASSTTATARCLAGPRVRFSASPQAATAQP